MGELDLQLQHLASFSDKGKQFQRLTIVGARLNPPEVVLVQRLTLVLFHDRSAVSFAFPSLPIDFFMSSVKSKDSLRANSNKLKRLASYIPDKTDTPIGGLKFVRLSK